MRYMRTMHIEKTSDGQPHYVYDLSLPLQERIAKRMWFPSATAAANFLGVTPQRVFTNRKNKQRVWSEAHGGWFAVRIANLQTERV